MFPIAQRPDRKRVSVETLLIFLACGWLPPLAARTAAQAPPTTTTTSTSTTTTTSTLPAALQDDYDDLTALASYAERLRNCHTEAARRTVQVNVLQASCAAVGRPRKQKKCERKVRRARCRSVKDTMKCDAGAVGAVPPGVAPGLASELRALLRMRTRTIACIVGTPVHGIVTDPEEDCPRRPRRIRNLPGPTCSGSGVCPIECANDAITTTANALRDAIDCRRTSISRVAAGEVFDEQACMSRVWSACRTDECGTDPCFDMTAMCSETRSFLEEKLGTFVTGCSTDGVPTCDDGNPCTVDRCVPCGSPGCTGVECAHAPTADGTVCAEDDDPCTVSVCRQGTCSAENSADGTACADDVNPCTADVCRRGTCTHPAIADRRGQPCDGSMCTVCTADEATMRCLPRRCAEGCFCNPDLGCLLPGGTDECPDN